MILKPEHLAYLKERGVKPERLKDRYRSVDNHLGILYCDSSGTPFKDSSGRDYVVRRMFPTGRPKFKAPTASGSRPYFSPLMPEGYLDDITIPLVLIEGPVKVDSCYEHIPVGFCFVGLTGTWNIVDKRDEGGKWDSQNDTRVLPELKSIPMKGRLVIVLFDSDIADNSSVAKAAKFIANWVRRRGARPHKVLLPNEPNGAKNGADDFLVRHDAAQLIDLLMAPKVIGWPVPAPLLTDDGDFRNDYDGTEEQELIAAIAETTDISLVDSMCRRVSSKLRRRVDELLLLVDDARNNDSDLGFLSRDEDLDAVDLDSRWLVPDFLPKGEVVIIAADGGVGKSLLIYDLCRAFITGGTFLGFNVPKLRVLILQLEEGASMGTRLKAMGFHQLGQRRVDWDTSQSFDLAKPKHCDQFKRLLQNHFDFVMIDPLRGVTSLAIDENTQEFGKRVVRPLRELITSAGASAIVIHHNSRHSGKYAGNGDIKAAVWGLYSLKRLSENDHDNLQLSNLECHDGKTRDGDPILWHIRKQRCEGFDGSNGNVQWTLEAMLQHTAPDLPLLKRFQTNLAMQPKPLTLREMAAVLGVPDDKDGKVNGTLRACASKSAAIRQWAVKKNGQPTRYWMPIDRRPESIQKQTESAPASLTTNKLTLELLEGESRDNQGLEQGSKPATEEQMVNSDPVRSATSLCVPHPADRFTESSWALQSPSFVPHPLRSIPVHFDGINGANLIGKIPGPSQDQDLMVVRTPTDKIIGCSRSDFDSTH